MHARVQGTVAWALAGRNRAKLEAVRNSLASINPYCKVDTAACRPLDVILSTCTEPEPGLMRLQHSCP